MTSLIDQFRRIEKERWSGELEISSSQGKALVLIKDGRLIWIHRPFDRMVDKWNTISWLVLPPP